MNILLISQCTKKAAVETCRIVDQFAERSGDRTWKTHITQQGLDMLRTLLKRSARKNTAVACHWIRGRDHIELLWIVGNANCFNERGAVPTNTTQRDILRKKHENDWHTLQDIKIVTAIAALFHDFGKSSNAFQAKLKNAKPISDPYRHEWVSLCLFQAFVGDNPTDKDWLCRLSTLDQAKDIPDLGKFIQDGTVLSPPNPFKKLPPLAQIVGWLILSHHFLPQSDPESFQVKKLKNPLQDLDCTWNKARKDAAKKEIEACWIFQKTPFASHSWRERASYWGIRALKRPKIPQITFKDLFSLHLARLSLMLADHYYSSLPASASLGDRDFSLYANTDPEGKCKQRLDEHLIGVEQASRSIVKVLPQLTLPSIKNHRGFKQRTTDMEFRWQNEAYDLASSLRERTVNQGFFGVNMASTGCGKTFANGRIMYALANPNQGARFCIALGLRTLTLQTGDAYRTRLKLGADDLAVLVGSSAVKELFEQNKEAASGERGSESVEDLISDYISVNYDGALGAGPLEKWLKKSDRAHKLLSAPLVVCTIDHLIGATEGIRGGKQIAPMLRLLTSDLVLDEPDDFDIKDLPALSRLVHWAGMLGSRVLLSSATLPPALVQGLFDAYYAGRTLFQKSRGIPGLPVNICCAWFDEHKVAASNHAESIAFRAAHDEFIAKRIEKLKHPDHIRRRAAIKPLLTTIQKDTPALHQEVACSIHPMLHELHQKHHSIDPKTNKKISFGLIRIANIDPLIDIAQHLFMLGAWENYRIKLCCYHAQHPLLIRHHIENQLDRLLQRHEKNAIFNDREIRTILDKETEDNILFIVLASPVAEVGRDHDYDWAIVEPSSMRSIIQLAGRVKRHRKEICTEPNIYLLNANIRSLKKDKNKIAYHRPGFEKDGYFSLNVHQLDQLLLPEQYEIINAIPRICSPSDLNHKENLAALEHARLDALMFEKENQDDVCVRLWWEETQATLCGDLQIKTRFRRSQSQNRFALSLKEEDDEKAKFYDLSGEKPKEYDKFFEHIDTEVLNFGSRINAWPEIDYESLLREKAEQQRELTVRDYGFRFGWIDLDASQAEKAGWCYNSLLGLRRKPQ